MQSKQKPHLDDGEGLSMDTEGAEGMRVGRGAGQALRRRLSSLCQTLSLPPLPSSSWRRPPPQPLSPGLLCPASLPSPPAVLHAGTAPSDALRHLGTPQRRPSPTAAPSSVSASRFVFSSRMVLPGTLAPSRAVLGLCWRSVLDACSCSASGCLLSLCTGHGPGSCRLASPACSPPGPSVSELRSPDSPS